MATQIISQHQKVPEKVIRHSLNNTIKTINILDSKLKEKGYNFLKNQQFGHYSFNFYCPKLKIALEIDGYAHEFQDILNRDAPKKLFVSSLGVTVLRFTDYQVLVDIEEIFRAIKNESQITTVTSYVV